MNKVKGKHFLTKLIFFLTVFAGILLSSCDNISVDDIVFDGDIKKDVSGSITVEYQFYEYEDLQASHKAVKFKIGQNAESSEFPEFTHEDTMITGWRYFYDADDNITELPGNFNTDGRNFITSVLVTSRPAYLYAVWAKKCTVNFVTDCDTTFDSIVIAEGSLIDNTMNKYMQLRREGYIFDGWYTDSEFENQFEFTTPVTQDLTLYVKWSPICYVRLHKNDGSSETDDYGNRNWNSLQVWQYAQGETFWIPECIFGERNDFGFVGWAKTASATVPDYYGDEKIEELTGDIDLYAVWSSDIVTITYNDTLGGNSSIAVKYGRGAHAKIGSICKEDNNRGYLENIWTVSGKQIKWWAESPDADLDTPEEDRYYNWNTINPLENSLTLYTVWGDRSYGISFNYINNNETLQFTYVNVDYGSVLNKPEYDPYVPGMTFSGWYKSTDGGKTLAETPYNFSTVLTEETVGENSYGFNLYAKFLPGEPVRTEFFVYESSWWPFGNDVSGYGTYDKPYLTVSKAIQTINAQNDSTKDYKIYVRGSIRDSLNITTLNAKSLTIKAMEDSWFNIKPVGYQNRYDTEEEIPYVVHYEKNITLTFDNLDLYGYISDNQNIILTGSSTNIIPEINIPPEGTAQFNLTFSEEENSEISVNTTRTGNNVRFSVNTPANYTAYTWKVNNVVKTEYNNSNIVTFNTSAWPNGIYDITLLAEDSDGNVYSYFAQITKN